MVVWLRRLAWCAVGLMLLWIVAWLALPPLLEWLVPPKASEALGRAVTIGMVRFKPWTLELTVSDVAIAGPSPGSEPLLQMKQVHVDLAFSSLVKLAPVIEALEIDAPQIRVARISEGHYDIDDLIARFTPRADAPPSKPQRFALYNLQVRDAQLRFEDRPLSQVHKIEELRLAIPFISNLPAEVDVKVEPRLAFKLNGTPFDSGAQATPFAQNKAGEMKLTMADLNLAPYLSYLPASLPVKVTQGSVSADLSLQFSVSPNATPSVVLKGTVGSKDLGVTDASGQPLLAWQRLELGLRDVQPFARSLAFEALHVQGMQLHATRDSAGRINLLDVATSPPRSEVSAGVSRSEPASAASESASAPVTEKASSSPVWKLSLESLDLAGTRVLWNDARVKPAAALQLDGLNIGAKQVRWPIEQPIAVSVAGALHTQTAGAPVMAQFTAEGPVTDHEAKLKLKITALALGALSPYLAQSLVPSLDGEVGAQAELDWSGSADAPHLKLAIDRLTLDGLKLREAAGAADAVGLKQLALADVNVDLLAHSAEVGSVKLLQPSVMMSRDKAGRFNVQDWMVAAAPGETPPPTAPRRPVGQENASKNRRTAAEPPRAAPSPGEWRVRLKDLLIDEGELRYSDAFVRRGSRREPVRIGVNGLHLAVEGLDLQGDRVVNPASIQLSARLGAASREKARLGASIDYKGHASLDPLKASGSVNVVRFPVHLFAPYFADRLPVSLLHADASYTGNLDFLQSPEGVDMKVRGDVQLTDVHVASLADAAAGPDAIGPDELLSWQSLALKGVQVAMRRGERPQVEIGAAALNDFYARLLVTEQGRFNLQQVKTAPAGGAGGDTDQAAPVAGAGQNGSSPFAPSAVPAAPAAPAASASAADDGASGLPLDIKIGGTTLANGRVDFTDHFVRPNYSAALTELNGHLGPFSSASREMATLDLHGRAEGTAQLEISGQLNPTVKPLALDIHAKATDLELAPLSPYAGKYAGYAIERGKLTMDVTYKIDADGKLDAKNQVILNQLTFGEKIESKDATKLPVLLAVALLKDRNGVIDINLPVSGSVNDPQFSVGGLIIKVLINLLTRAITAPFSLLAGGGESDLSQVEFTPGTAVIAPSGNASIDKVAKALTDKTSLKMTVTGAADPVVEHDAFQHAEIEARVLALQSRDAGHADAPAGAASAPAPLTPYEHLALLRQVYKQTNIPDKPRNALGFVKDLPSAEMEALLKTRTPVSDDALRELAMQRGVAVRDALLAKGLPSERIFLAAPQLRAAGADAKGWTPRAELSLATN